MPNLWLIFITGLFTGGITCMAVQGGLLTATLMRLEEDNPAASRAPSIIAFLVTKLAAYTLLGMALGWLGSFFQLSLTFQAGLMIFVALFMVGTALALLDVHPLFRYFIIQPPRFLTRIVRQTSKNQSLFAPAMVGALTIFIPCGTTQAMMALAISTRSWAAGALTMFAFILGTSPLFFLLGYSIDVLKEKLKANFAKVAATIIVLLAVWNFNSGLVLAASPVNLQTVWRSVFCTVSFCSDEFTTGQPGQSPTIRFLASGYSVDNPVIPAGKPITLTLTNYNGAGCIQSFVIPKLGISEIVTVGKTKTVNFTAPATPGVLAFSCGMGMYTGRLIVQ